MCIFLDIFQSVKVFHPTELLLLLPLLPPPLARLDVDVQLMVKRAV